MSITTLPRHDPGNRDLPRRPMPQPRTIGAIAIMVGLFIASVWSVIDLRINIASIIDSWENATRFVGRMFPLDFPEAGELVGLIGVTLAIVILATVLSVVLSVPVALLAAANTAPNTPTRAVARGFIVLTRAIPDLILAIFFMRVFNLGALPGVLAMGIHSIGMVGKLYADAVESLDNGPQEAVRAAGGGRTQQIIAGILPPLMPQIIATALHRFDINLRTSVILGYVGVGGIGLALADSLRSLNYQRGMALAFVVLVLCVVTELISGALRTAIMTGDTGRRSWSDKLWQSVWPSKPVTREKISPPWTKSRVERFSGLVFLILVVIACLIAAGINPVDSLIALGRMPQTLGLFLPPGGWDILDNILADMLVTVQIGLAATLLGAILAIPIGILAARNVVAKRWIATLFRVIIVTVRAIPELIIAIIFVVISGLGGVAGTLALTIGAIGLLSKLIADSLEETDTRVQDALLANGATRSQVFFGATLRQAMPAFVAHIMYLLDVNIRSATLLGIVGAGGIGFLLLNASRVLEFQVVTTIVLFILIVVLLVEAMAIFVRKVVQ
ncbi:phosphonate ABC transporter, permease protein PhnE [Ammonicoccus fulvus]|uniref:Phosphonate ABC transporter, permease protein PhnE n=1 Tax=Ammonicoccus fulvus TaxID=3138240 RepID=A0ABZ3FMD2_9ACTN